MAADPKDPEWYSIAQQASIETDSAKLSILVSRLCAALDRCGEPRVVHALPTCPICNKPVNVERGRNADENGKVMHEGCYMQRMMRSSRNDPPNPQHTE
jgi:hypothetical protein